MRSRPATALPWILAVVAFATVLVFTSAPAGAQDAEAVDYTECDRQRSVPAQECYGVAAIHVTAEGAGWVDSTNWLRFDDVCSWFGVVCRDGHVVELRLSDNNLNGTLPVEISQLQALESLRLRNNELHGTIPLEFGGLAALTDLDLAGNRLEGSIPVELALANRLRSLNLSGNALVGTVPTELGELAMLQVLDLSANELSGTLPRELGALSRLEYLSVASNRLDGSLPGELAALPELYALDVSDNHLTGSIPLDFAESLRLESLSMAGNADMESPDQSIVDQLARNAEGVAVADPSPEVTEVDDLAPVAEPIPDQPLAFTLPEVKPNRFGETMFVVLSLAFAGLAGFGRTRRST